MKKASRKSSDNTLRCEIHVTWRCHINILLASRIDVQPACGQFAAVSVLSFPRAGTGYARLRVSFICIVVGQGNPTRGPE